MPSKPCSSCEGPCSKLFLLGFGLKASGVVFQGIVGFGDPKQLSPKPLNPKPFNPKP